MIKELDILYPSYFIKYEIKYFQIYNLGLDGSVIYIIYIKIIDIKNKMDLIIIFKNNKLVLLIF